MAVKKISPKNPTAKASAAKDPKKADTRKTASKKVMRSSYRSSAH